MDKIKRNIDTMHSFEATINTCDDKMAEKLIDKNAVFFTPASPEPLYGGQGYLSLVRWLRKSFSNIQWHIEDMVVEVDKIAVMWNCHGTNDGEFMDHPATNKEFTTSFMNFYYFNEEGKITKDLAGAGMIGIFQSLGMKF